jgi:polysaccharide export outer membrane protein
VHGHAVAVKYALASLLALGMILLLGASAPQEVIHPGDQLSVQVFGEQPQTETVLPDGSIEYPLLGRIHLAGMTIPSASQMMAEKLKRYVRNPLVTILVTKQGKPTILVLGNVKTPGKYTVRADARLTDALAAAGGIADVNGPLPDARISDDAGNIKEVSLEQLLQKGDLGLDMPLANGDVVYVPGPVTFNVVVSGAVDHPGEIQISQGDRLAMAIAKAGDSTNSQADLNHIKVMRTLPNGQQQVSTYDLYKALDKNDPSADPVLQKGDVVYVPEARGKNSRNFVNGAGGAGFFYLLERLLLP